MLLTANLHAVCGDSDPVLCQRAVAAVSVSDCLSCCTAARITGLTIRQAARVCDGSAGLWCETGVLAGSKRQLQQMHALLKQTTCRAGRAAASRGTFLALPLRSDARGICVCADPCSCEGHSEGHCWNAAAGAIAATMIKRTTYFTQNALWTTHRQMTHQTLAIVAGNR